MSKIALLIHLVLALRIIGPDTIRSPSIWKIPMASNTGVNTNGLQVRLDVKNLQNADGTEQIRRVYMALHSDCIFEIRAGGVSKLD